LLAEWVENLRPVDEQRDEELMETLINSAEAYLQMWEQVESQRVPSDF